jgi:poly(3-hydroxybutyrate) depolymerase
MALLAVIRTSACGCRKRLVALGAPLRETRLRLGAESVRPYVFGFSNGGYFAAMLASETQMKFAGLGIAHAGIVDGAKFDSSRAVPTILVSADGDTHQKPRMDKLHLYLDGKGWPHKYVVRPGEHGLTEADIKLVISFFADAAVAGSSERR